VKMSASPSEVLMSMGKGKKAAKVKITDETVDAIASVAKSIENLSKDAAYAAIPALLDDVNLNYFKLGGVLSVIRDNKWWHDQYGEIPFMEFLEKHFGLHYRKAMYLIQIYNDLIESGVKWDQVKEIGWTKLKEISSIITPDNVVEWVELAKVLNTIQLAERVSAAKAQTLETSGKIPEDAPDVSVSSTSKISFKVHEDQKATIELAISKAKGEAGTEYDSVALEAICLNYLSGGKTTKPKSLTEILSTHGPEEVLKAFEKVWPAIDITVESMGEL
jgi:hypothetical protein